MSKANAAEKPDFRNSTVYWFVLLEQARKRRDLAALEEAIANLRRLGVTVQLRAELEPAEAGE